MIKLKFLLLKYLRIIKYSLKGIGFKEAVLRASYKSSCQYALGRSAKIDYVPEGLYFHVMHCNLNCPNCLYALKSERPFTFADFIPLEKFEELLDSYPFKQIALSGGEALLHPQFDKLVQACVKRGLTLGTSTNGILIKKWINSLKHFQRVNVSIDGHDYASFQKYRAGTKEQFDLILEGLRLLKENNIKFTVSFLLSAENIHEYPKIIDFAFKYRPARLVLHSINPHGSSSYRPLFSDNPEVQHFLKDIMSRNDYPFAIKLPIIFDVKTPGFRKAVCPQLWDKLDVNEKGDVAYCCHLNHDPAIGNIFQGYDFNSPKMIQMRKSHITSNVPEDCTFCHRRFPEQHYALFKASKKQWKVHGYTK